MQGAELTSAGMGHTVEHLASMIRGEILRGSFRPSSAVTDRSVVETYSVSRPTARAAIASVLESGLLERRRNSSPTVPIEFSSNFSNP